MTTRVLSTVLNQTQFGLVSEIRIVLAIAVAACLAYYRLRWRNGSRQRRPLPRRRHRLDRPRRLNAR